MFVKSPEVKESVTLHVIFDPLAIFCETLVSVAPLLILKFAFAVWYVPSSILYSTFTYIVELSLLVILIVDEPCEPAQAIAGGFTTVMSGSQSTASLASMVSSDILVKSSEVNESVILHVIVDPSGTEAVCEVSVLLADIDKLVLVVVKSPSLILYSTL